jgi:hypothetical protein
MPADETRAEGQEIPLGSGRAQHFHRVDAEAVEDDRELVHQGDIEVALRVLDHFRRFRDLDRGRLVHARRDDAAVDLRNALERLRRVARDDLRDLGQRALLVAGVDALRRIADVEVFAPAHLRMLLQHGDADLLRGPRIDGGFVDDRRAPLHVLADRLRRTEQRPEVRLVRIVHWRGNGNDDEIRLGQRGRIGSHGELRGRAERVGRHFAGRIDVALIARDLFRREVESDRPVPLTELDRKRQADITQAHDGNSSHLFSFPFLRWAPTPPAFVVSRGGPRPLASFNQSPCISFPTSA